MDRPTCKTCVYWNPEDPWNGKCQRRPPKSKEGFEFGFQPGTHDDDWCGEHNDFVKWMIDRPKPSTEAASCQSPSDSAGDPGTTDSSRSPS